VDLNGVRTEHGPIFATPGLSDGLTPGQFKLYQNYPNPFNPSTTLQLYVPANSDKQSSVKVEIYNVVGQKVRTLFDGNLSAGVHALTWNGESDQGFAVPGGIYFAVLSAGTYTDNIKLVLLK
jgi:flagellar hook assembly protein FlgD